LVSVGQWIHAEYECMLYAFSALMLHASVYVRRLKVARFLHGPKLCK